MSVKVKALKKNKLQHIAIAAVIGFSAIILGFTVFMTIKNTGDLQAILEDSIEAQLLSTCYAAREILDAERFLSYNSPGDVSRDFDYYYETLESLRELQRQTGSEYIYALKIIDGEYYFIFDTDYEDDTLFEAYGIAEVHRRAFHGEDAAGVMNVNDDYGSFNTGAVPIWLDGAVIGIISADIEDKYVQKSEKAAFGNALLLTISLFAIMCAMTAIVTLLISKIHKMQEKLFKMANYDVLTGLPNRHYLMYYLPEFAGKSIRKQSSFALMLIDLDNFKTVNDNAGHDAGDELLRNIGEYLANVLENSKSFRPTAGLLNVSARIGGDEFVLVVPGASTEEDAIRAAQYVIENFRIKISNRYIEKYNVGMSIGIALFPYHTDNYNVLIKYADIAMYHAKKSGKNTYSVYNDEMRHTDTSFDPERHRTAVPDRRKIRVTKDG